MPFRRETIEGYTFATVPASHRLKGLEELYPPGAEIGLGRELIIALDKKRHLVGAVEVYDPDSKDPMLNRARQNEITRKIVGLRNSAVESLTDTKTFTTINLGMLRYLWQKGIKEGTEGYVFMMAAAAHRNYSDILGLRIEQIGPPFGIPAMGTLIPYFLPLNESAVDNPSLNLFLKCEQFNGWPHPKWDNNPILSPSIPILTQRLSLGIC